MENDNEGPDETEELAETAPPDVNFVPEEEQRAALAQISRPEKLRQVLNLFAQGATLRQMIDSGLPMRRFQGGIAVRSTRDEAIVDLQKIENEAVRMFDELVHEASMDKLRVMMRVARRQSVDLLLEDAGFIGQIEERLAERRRAPPDRAPWASEGEGASPMRAHYSEWKMEQTRDEIEHIRRSRAKAQGAPSREEIEAEKLIEAEKFARRNDANTGDVQALRTALRDLADRVAPRRAVAARRAASEGASPIDAGDGLGPLVDHEGKPRF